MYPILLRLEELPCLVVGAGAVAARKIVGLLEAGGRVTVVSPEAHSEVHALAEKQTITWRRRPYRRGDLRGFRLAIAATSSPEVNAQVYAEARSMGIPVNAVDDPEHCTFFVPAVLRRGMLTLAISTAGAAPYLARRIREHLERRLYPGLEEDLEQVSRVRAQIAATAGDSEQKRILIDQQLEPLVRKILSRMEDR